MSPVNCRQLFMNGSVDIRYVLVQARLLQPSLTFVPCQPHTCSFGVAVPASSVRAVHAAAALPFFTGDEEDEDPYNQVRPHLGEPATRFSQCPNGCHLWRRLPFRLRKHGLYSDMHVSVQICNCKDILHNCMRAQALCNCICSLGGHSTGSAAWRPTTASEAARTGRPCMGPRRRAWIHARS